MYRLSGRDIEVVVDTTLGPPTIIHWGPPLGGEVDLRSLAAAHERPLVHGGPDVVAPIALVPEHGAGFPGRPGLTGHRPDGTAWAPRFTAVDVEGDEQRLSIVARDDVADLELRFTIETGEAFVVRAELANTSASSPYVLHDLSIALPLPATMTELLTFEGRWSREFHEQRRHWPNGTWLAENRRGRTSHEHPPVVFAGTRGFGEWRGEVRGAHLAWSGNHRVVADHLPDGRRMIQLGELLHPGEVVLGPGDRYAVPEVIAVHGHGLTEASQRFHRHLRARAEHPRLPRPVVLNTWEAVYFDHDGDRLRRLAELGARVGAERFVLDDGWFGSRRDDTSGLGDWVVAEEAHPEGLTPLIDHVQGLGMDFGIWVEPEMVNPDSDLFRRHPDWALTTDGYEPVTARHQLVLDLARPDAFDHVLGQLDALLRDHEIAFVKWDMNRDHIGAGGAGGAPGTHAHTAAVYRLIDELRRRHPRVEIESCSSGGARIDFEILRRTDRVWTSDCIDPLERQRIQRGASMLVPPELMGAHIGARRSHTTGRSHGLAFRGATAMFGSLGLELDLLDLDERELDTLGAIVDLHKRLRGALHGGDVVRFDVDDPYVAHGVYAPDRSSAIVSVAALRTASSQLPPPLELPGLDPARRYRIRHLAVPGERRRPGRTEPAWWSDGIELDGRTLGVHGLQLPELHPESAVLLQLT